MTYSTYSTTPLPLPALVFSPLMNELPRLNPSTSSDSTIGVGPPTAKISQIPKRDSIQSQHRRTCRLQAKPLCSLRSPKCSMASCAELST
jgi:hypothetical protein